MFQRPSLAALVAAILLTLLTIACGGDEAAKLEEAAAALSVVEGEVETAEAAVEERLGAVENAQTALAEAEAALADARDRLTEARSAVEERATDPVLFRTVQQGLLDEAELEGVAIAAEVREGVVTLKGDVEDPSQRDVAVKIAAETPGVLRVEDRIQVRAAPEPALMPGMEEQGT